MSVSDINVGPITLLAWVRRQRLGRMSMFSAGPLLADEANPRQARSVALTTSEGLVGVWVGWSEGGPSLSPLSFFFQSSSRQAVSLWNGLPDDMKDLQLDPFKQKLWSLLWEDF